MPHPKLHTSPKVSGKKGRAANATTKLLLPLPFLHDRYIHMYDYLKGYLSKSLPPEFFLHSPALTSTTTVPRQHRQGGGGREIGREGGNSERERDRDKGRWQGGRGRKGCSRHAVTGREGKKGSELIKK